MRAATGVAHRPAPHRLPARARTHRHTNANARPVTRSYTQPRARSAWYGASPVAQERRAPLRDPPGSPPGALACVTALKRTSALSRPPVSCSGHFALPEPKPPPPLPGRASGGETTPVSSARLDADVGRPLFAEGPPTSPPVDDPPALVRGLLAEPGWLPRRTPPAATPPSAPDSPDLLPDADPVRAGAAPPPPARRPRLLSPACMPPRAASTALCRAALPGASSSLAEAFPDDGGPGGGSPSDPAPLRAAAPLLPDAMAERNRAASMLWSLTSWSLRPDLPGLALLECVLRADGGLDDAGAGMSRADLLCKAGPPARPLPPPSPPLPAPLPTPPAPAPPEDLKPASGTSSSHSGRLPSGFTRMLGVAELDPPAIGESPRKDMEPCDAKPPTARGGIPGRTRDGAGVAPAAEAGVAAAEAAAPSPGCPVPLPRRSDPAMPVP